MENSLKNKWSKFFTVVLDPWVLTLSVATIGLICYSSYNIENKELNSILTIVISVSSGILGGIISQRWSQINEMSVLIARGKSAIRGLKLILLNISNIENRTSDYIRKIDSSNPEFVLIETNFEEIIEKCNILEEEIISSIENWTDIVPEVANIKSQIGLISEMRTKQNQLIGELAELSTNLKSAEEDKIKDREELQATIAEKEKELKKTRSKLFSSENKINASVLSGLTGSSINIGHSIPISDVRVGTDTDLFWNRICTICSRRFQSNLGLSTDNLCDNCKSNTPNMH